MELMGGPTGDPRFRLQVGQAFEGGLEAPNLPKKHMEKHEIRSGEERSSGLPWCQMVTTGLQWWKLRVQGDRVGAQAGGGAWKGKEQRHLSSIAGHHPTGPFENMDTCQTLSDSQNGIGMVGGHLELLLIHHVMVRRMNEKHEAIPSKNSREWNTSCFGPPMSRIAAFHVEPILFMDL